MGVRRILLTAAAVYLLSGCTPTSEPTPSDSGIVDSSPSSTYEREREGAIADAPVEKSDGRLGERTEFSLAEMIEPRELVVNSWGVGVVADWGAGAPLVWFDQRTGESEEVARPDRAWSIDMASVSDDWLVWVEQDDLERDDPLQDVSWRVWAYEFASGETTLVAEPERLTPLTPGVAVAGSVLITVTYRGLDERSSDVEVYDLATGGILETLPEVAAGMVAWDGRHLLVDVTESITGPGEAKRDVYSYRDGDLVEVTNTDNSGGVAYAHGHVMWFEPTENSDGTVGPDRVMVRPWPEGGDVVLLTERESSAASLGSGFVVDWSLGEETVESPLSPVIISLDDPKSVFNLTNPEGTRLSVRPQAFGDKVAWVAEAIDGDRPGEGSVLVVQTVDLAG